MYEITVNLEKYVLVPDATRFGSRNPGLTELILSIESGKAKRENIKLLKLEPIKDPEYPDEYLAISKLEYHLPSQRSLDYRPYLHVNAMDLPISIRNTLRSGRKYVKGMLVEDGKGILVRQN